MNSYKQLQKEYPDLITSVTGTGLLYAVQLNDKIFSVVAADGADPPGHHSASLSFPSPEAAPRVLLAQDARGGSLARAVPP